MSLKKTDLVKNLAKKLDGKMKSAAVPQPQGSSKVAPQRHDDEARASAPAKLVPVACRLPADLLAQVREQAVRQERSINAIVAEALTQWLPSSRT